MVTIKDISRECGVSPATVSKALNGYDEISPIVPTDCFLIDDKGTETKFTINPEKFGITGCSEEELLGGNGAENVQLAMDVLNGNGRKTIKAAVGLNTAAVLYISGKAKNLQEGYKMAVDAIDSGKTLEKIRQIQEISQSL